MKKRAGQVTLFIILAIAIVALIGGYAFFRYQAAQVPVKFTPIEQSFLDCINARVQEGASLLGSGAGYIYVPDFEPGSQEYPTSNQMDFMGESVPYWFYVSGNGIAKENIPSIADMQNQLNRYVQENLGTCDFSDFRARGFSVELQVKKVSTTIQDNSVRANVDADLIMGFENDTSVISTHQANTDSKLGKFYKLAANIYNKEKQETFLENYTIDVLYLYAPTTNSELTCSPKVWLLENISNDLKTALEANLMFVRPGSQDKYFNLNIATTSDENVRFLYSRNWPTKIYTPNENGLLIAKPVGTQEGLGILGFCITAYHFVYDINYPVMVQIYDEQEFFQFPVNVIVKGNRPREPLPGTAVEVQKQSVCQYKNTLGKVYTYDSELNPIEADIAFKCFSEQCIIGKTEITGNDAVLETLFPQCVNGLVMATKEGYTMASSIVSSNKEFDTGLILNKLYKLNVDVKIAGKSIDDNAIIYFTSGSNNQVVNWPNDKTVELTEGFYNVSMYIFANTTLTLPATTTNKCINVPRPGIAGIFGATTEKCFDVTIPGQKIDSAMVGGGNAQEYILESQLKNAKLFEISVPSIVIPKSLEDMQNVYDSIDRNLLTVEIK